MLCAREGWAGSLFSQMTATCLHVSGPLTKNITDPASGEGSVVIFLDTELFPSMDPRPQNRVYSLPERQECSLGDLPVMEDRGVVCKNDAGDVPGPKEALKGGRWEGLGLVQPPELHGREASTTSLQGAQEGLHLVGRD